MYAKSRKIIQIMLIAMNYIPVLYIIVAGIQPCIVGGMLHDKWNTVQEVQFEGFFKTLHRGL